MMEYSFENFCVGFVLFWTASGWLVTLGVKINYGRLKNSVTKLEFNPKLAWFLFEVPNLLWALYFLIIEGDSLSLGYALFIIHYINRDIVYPLRLKTQTKVPLEIVASAFSFTLANGYLQGIANKQVKEVSTLWKGIGVCLFSLGMWINIKSDSILQKAKQASIKKTEDRKSKYVRIDEFLFKYVANPNYFGEIVEWFGYFVVTQHFYGALFVFSTFNVLTAAAIPRNKWNKENIPTYPKERKAIIPFVI